MGGCGHCCRAHVGRVQEAGIQDSWPKTTPAPNQRPEGGLSHFRVLVPSTCVLSPTAWVRGSFFLSSWRKRNGGLKNKVEVTTPSLRPSHLTGPTLGDLISYSFTVTCSHRSAQAGYTGPIWWLGSRKLGGRLRVKGQTIPNSPLQACSGPHSRWPEGSRRRGPLRSQRWEW